MALVWPLVWLARAGLILERWIRSLIKSISHAATNGRGLEDANMRAQAT